MSFQTPDWVKNAVFYQIYPIALRAAPPCPQLPGLTVQAVGRTAGRAGLSGRRSARRRGSARLPPDAGRQRHLPEPDLCLGLQPSLPHLRLHAGRSAVGRQRCAARTARRRARARHVRGAGRRLQPRQPRLLGLSSHPGMRRQFALYRLVQGPRLAAAPLQHDADNPINYDAWWDIPALPKFNIQTPVCANICWTWRATGSTLASTAGGWTCPRRSTTRAFWQEFRAHGQGGQPRRLHRRRNLARGARVAARRPLRRRDELRLQPAGARLLWRRHAAHRV
jgi:hypothetical protein